MQQSLGLGPEYGRFEFQKWAVYREAVLVSKEAQKF